MSQATGVAGAYQGPVRVVSPLEPSIGQSWWAPIEQMRPRKGLTRLNFLSHEIAGRHSVYPPLGPWQPTLVVLPGESHRQRNLEGYGP